MAYTLLREVGRMLGGAPRSPPPPPQGTRLPLAVSGREETTPLARCHPSQLLEPRAVVKSPHVNFEDLNQNMGKSLHKDRDRPVLPQSDVGRGKAHKNRR